ncbi:probable E3 ubiquitin-protein ligase LUL4 [Andrographis paniculata]|uniref:probable E3 ubiquitin-protein ligase LUL4 n=1 Tax=Andrographis paniculata TaxID=175694 RepID=UPI0021E762E4|nr:probable E3 ubiquitin-protein ligase LUL4 [Andrographis paniculata]XP_051145274.1 probable E3 ubiquitin-protein ligase LUL4 [Andrographis paniculata]
MGISWSKNHNRYQQHHQQHHHNHPPIPPPPYSNPPPLTFTGGAPSLPQSSTTPSASVPPPQRPTYAFAANAPYSVPEQHPYPAIPSCPARPPPPPPLPPYNLNYNYHARPVNFAPPYPHYRPYYPSQPTGWGSSAGPFPPQPLLQPAPYVDHQSAKKVKNDVNVHKDTIMLQLDELNPESHLVCFTFDAMVDGSITIFYFAKEGENCKFSPVYPEIVPVKIPFQKGLGQKFCQPSGTGLDFGFFDTDDLSKPSPGDDIYPLVISAESSKPSGDEVEHSREQVNTSPHAQITQAIIEKKDGGNFKVKVVKQILWIDGDRYELREIFGISNSEEAAVSDVESGKECVICMTEVKNTAVLPCRHMCMCSDCAKELRLQSNKCPVCRQPIEELLEIKVDQDLLT